MRLGRKGVHPKAHTFQVCTFNFILTLMYTIAVLGNPGPEYEQTRHNSGRVVLREVIKHLGLPVLVNSSRFGGRISEGNISGQEVVIFFPDTYMNESGKAIKKAVGEDEVRNLIVVYDEVDLPFGEFKVSVSRGDAGHNGIKNVIAALGTKDFTRIRIGIAPKTLFGKVVRPRGDKLARYVLGKLSKKETAQLEKLAPNVAEALSDIVGH